MPFSVFYFLPTYLLLHLHQRRHVVFYERLHQLILSVLLQNQDTLLKLGNELPRRLLKLLKTLLCSGEPTLKQSGVVGRDKLSFLGLGHLWGLDGGVLKNNPEPRLVVDDARLLVRVQDALLKVYRGAALKPAMKVNVRGVIGLAILIGLGNKVNVVNFSKMKEDENLGNARLRDVGEHVGNK